ncbi:type III pantothenate kinase [Neptuniibacter sp. CAU 1671]|uniref:type III pantothenate kinase n=1 Tax=Neptuniibacter sp. CAU 1671 TaxID=3032593 RepID=UPI0023DB59D1|nr:type III pantothenate kinase [Neptuniibacter sp. CAU 1671]MDF2182666.1 type III pantothenate kinase [Neptuniibacter sp. CAU 1671]
MILEIDAGNSFVKWRITQAGGAVVAAGRSVFSDLESQLPAAWPTKLSEVRVASVAGEVNNQQLLNWLQPLSEHPVYFARTAACCAGVANSYEDPSRMGVDRWLAMLAAYNEAHCACCVVDCGSAITVDYLTAQGQHIGGYILPGLRLMTESLLKDTARVRFATEQMQGHNTSPGTDTASAVGHGVNYLFTALQEKIINELAPDMRLFITGGDGALFHTLAGCGEWREHLVLDGLRWSQS